MISLSFCPPEVGFKANVVYIKCSYLYRWLQSFSRTQLCWNLLIKECLLYLTIYLIYDNYFIYNLLFLQQLIIVVYECLIINLCALQRKLNAGALQIDVGFRFLSTAFILNNVPLLSLYFIQINMHGSKPVLSCDDVIH